MLKKNEYVHEVPGSLLQELLGKAIHIIYGGQYIVCELYSRVKHEICIIWGDCGATEEIITHIRGSHG